MGLIPHLPETQRIVMYEYALEIARNFKSESKKSYGLNLLVRISKEDTKSNIVIEATNSARKIEDVYNKAKEMSKLVPHLKEPIKSEVVEEILLTIRDSYDEMVAADSLSILAPYLTDLYLNRALSTVRSIQDYINQDVLLLSILHQFHDLGLSDKALILARGIKDRYFKAIALAHIGFLEASLAEVEKIDNPSLINMALAELEPALPDHLIERAFGIVQSIQDKYMRIVALNVIIPRLQPPLKYEILNEGLIAAKSIQDEYKRTIALNVLVPHLKHPLKFEIMKEALETVDEICDSYSKSTALSALAPNLTWELLMEAFKTAFLIKPPYNRDDVLAKLVIRLAELNQTEDALEGIQSIQSGYVLAKVINDLVPLLPDSLLGYTLAIARSIERDDSKVTALCSLFPRLYGSSKKEVLKEAFDTAIRTEGEHTRSWALTKLITILPQESLRELLPIAREIKDEFYKGPLMAELVFLLPEPLKEDALKEALTSISKIQAETKDFQERPEALGKLASYMAGLPQIRLYPLWCETLHLLAYHIREDLLIDIQALIPVIIALGGPDALEVIAQAIDDVSSWWP